MNNKAPLTINHIQEMKRQGEKIAMLTCYDAAFARAMDEAGVDIILVGDSMGMVVQGMNSTVAVSVDDIAYHTRCVARGLERTLCRPWGGKGFPHGRHALWQLPQ